MGPCTLPPVSARGPGKLRAVNGLFSHLSRDLARLAKGSGVSTVCVV